MSVRDFMEAVRSVQRILDMLESKDTTLFEEMLRDAEQDLRDEFGDDEDMDHDERQEFDEVLDDKKEQLRLFLMSDTAPATEPGSMLFVIERVIERENLRVELPLKFNEGYKHICWEPYRQLVDGQLSDAARKALAYLDARPFRGEELEFDGCLYGWLRSDEIQALHQSLAAVTFDNANADAKTAFLISEFHPDLVDALFQLQENGCECVLVAC